MSEFRFWVVIVSLLIFLHFVTWMGILYMDKRLKHTEAIVYRAEQVDKKSKQKLEPKPEEE